MYCIPFLHVSSLLSNEIVIGFIRRRRKNSERKKYTTEETRRCIVNYARNRRLFIGLMRYFSHCLGKSWSIVSIQYNTIISCILGIIIQSWLKKEAISESKNKQDRNMSYYFKLHNQLSKLLILLTIQLWFSWK